MLELSLSKAPTIEETLLRALKPGTRPQALLQAVRAVHPEASKKEIIHAAFVAIIAVAERDPGLALELQNFAIKGRGVDE